MTSQGIDLNTFIMYTCTILIEKNHQLSLYTYKLFNGLAQICNKKSLYTRGIWKVLSMVFYLSNRFTNPIMFGIMLKSYRSSMLWHIFHEDILMPTRRILL